MTATSAIVLFLSTKTADVIPVDDLPEDVAVGQVRKVPWKGRLYKAKIVFLGSKDECEEKIVRVSRKGKILDENVEMEIIEGSSADRREPSPDDAFGCSSDNIKLDEALTRLNEMRSEMVTKEHEAESRDAHKKIIDLLTEILAINKAILERQTSSERSADELQYNYVSRERVEALRKYRCDNIAQFALDLEKEVYKDKPSELLLRVSERLETASRMEFIKKCIFKYFHVAEQAQAATWRSVMVSLNARARRERGRQQAQTTPTRGGLVGVIQVHNPYAEISDSQEVRF
ncbi:hypothetical protein ANCCAN_13920 [Ancylostoma caninum]|uniref:Uncharacterized protein n=1 Tax=Ancylostoma caninum TaxID=29170 RepID=A0A368GA24_ANCCA|nr:hypothetical protein ANCCAN_13920 [Ancylostoma caninum]